MTFLKKNYAIIFGALFIFVLFFYMTKSISLYGDDWCYYTNTTANPFQAAVDYYFLWSGRFFSELWTYICVRYKQVYEWLNPIMFTTIFLLTIYISKSKKKLVSTFALIALILTVKDEIRTQTYSWITGSVYTVALFFLIILVAVYYYIIRENKKSWILNSLTIICNVYICLAIENAAVIVLALNLIVLIYCYFKDKHKMQLFISLFVISIISFFIMRSSPGSTFRLARDHQDWINMNLFEQMIFNLPNFLSMTFIDPRVAIITFIIVCIVLLFQKEKSKKVLLAVSFIVSLYFVIIVGNFAAERFSISILKIIFDFRNSQFSLIWITLYFIVLITTFFIIFYRTLDRKNFEDSSLFLLLAGIGNASMLLSPVYGHRSTLYMLFFMFIIILKLLNEIEMNRVIICGLCFMACGVIIYKVNQYQFKYNLAVAVEKEREIEIDYYRDNPEILDIYITAMPEYIVHSANIYPDDEVHASAFKAYYGLNPEATIYMAYKYR